VNLLITGATGFLGSALLGHWLRQGNTISVLTKPSSSLMRLASVEQSLRIASYASDNDVIQLVQDIRPDVIVHNACLYGRKLESVLQILDVNVRLGLLLIQGALLTSGKRISLINSGSVLDPSVSIYAMSKQHFSQWGGALARQNSSRFQFIDVRLQHMYGPGDAIEKFFSMVLHCCRCNRNALALTQGQQRRDFIYIDDVVSAYDTIIKNLDAFSDADQVDVGSGEAPTIRHVVETIHSLTGSRTKLQFGALPYRENEVMFSQADLHRMRGLGWEPEYDLEKGIRKIIELDSMS
jgi:nucleoside-diphosphate-sugar epimerase